METTQPPVWSKRRAHPLSSRSLWYSIFLLSLLLLGLSLASCSGDGDHKTTISTSNQELTYGNATSDVVIRMYYAGGTKGSLNMGPQLSIYGDGSYILGLEKQGKIGTDGLQQLLRTIIDTNGLLKLKRQQFADIPDQNATFLQVQLNGKTYEYMYGPFGNHPQKPEDLEEYRQLEKAITSINQAIQGPTQPYKARDYALLTRYTVSYDSNTSIPAWTFSDFTLLQAALFECGKLYDNDDGDYNKETGCLKYTVPRNAILLNGQQKQQIQRLLGDQLEGRVQEGQNYYVVTIRPLLPDETVQKSLAMFGSNQLKYQKIVLHQGAIPLQKES